MFNLSETVPSLRPSSVSAIHYRETSCLNCPFTLKVCAYPCVMESESLTIQLLPPDMAPLVEPPLNAHVH